MRDERGSFAVSFAATAMLLLVGVAGAINFNDRAYVIRNLQSSVDAAAIYAATIEDDWHHLRRKSKVKAMLRQNLAQTIGAKKWRTARRADITFDDDDEKITVKLEYDYQPVLAIGMFSKSQKLRVDATASYPKNAVEDVSIVFVLDVSSSMSKTAGGTQPRIDALKDAVKLMFDAIETNVTDTTRATLAIRTAMVAYDSAIEETSGFTNGWTYTEGEILDLETDHGTDSSVGLAWAENALSAERAWRASQSSDPNYTLKEFVILVTDGNNNSTSEDAASKASCDRMKDLGATIYSVGVAAPTEGVAMLRNCATKSSTDLSLTLEEQTEGYMFEATSTTEFVKAFGELGATLLDEPTRLID